MIRSLANLALLRRHTAAIMPALRRERSFLKSQRHALTATEAQSRRVVAALWKAFPSATSEAALAEMAAPHFRKANGRPIAPRTIRYWLRGDTLPDHMHTMVLVQMVGSEVIFGGADP